MKTVINKKTNFEFNDKEHNYFDLITLCIESGGTQGVTNKDMLARFRISKVFNKDKPKYELEDSDAKKLLDIVEKMVWTKFDDALAEFLEDVKEQLTKKSTKAK